MAKTKSTYNKKRSMRRSTRKAGMFGLSSAPKSFHDLAKIKLKEQGENVNDATKVGQLAYALLGDSMLRPKEYDAKYPGWQKWDKNIPRMSGGKRRRSKKSTRKRGRKGGLSFMGRDFGDVRGNLGKLAAKSGMVSEDVFKKDRGMATGIGQGIRTAQTKLGEAANYATSGAVGADVFTKDRGMAKGARIGLGVANDMLLGKKIGGKRRRSKRSTKKAGNMSDLPGLGMAYLENKYDDAKKAMGYPVSGGKRKKSTRKRSRKH